MYFVFKPVMSRPVISTIPSKPFSNSTNSPYCTLESPYTRAIPSPTVNTLPISSNEAVESKPESCFLNIAETRYFPQLKISLCL